MKTTILSGLAILSAIMFAGCDVKDPIYDATYAITVSNDGNGTGAAKVGDANADKAVAGATVAITATPTGDYVFKQWTVISGGPLTYTGATSAATNPATFTMPAKAVEIRAEFEAISRSITMTTNGNGTAVADPADATAGTEVTITASPTDPASNQFKQWVVVSGGVMLSSATDNPATFTMGSQAVEIKAEFIISANAIAQTTILAYNTGESAGANTVYTFALPAAAPGATIAMASVVCNGSPVTSSLAGTGNIDLTFTDAVLAALPYDKDLTVTYTVTYGGQTSTAVTTHTIAATATAAMSEIQAIRKATADAEAAKITGFTAGINNRDNLVFNPVTGGGALAAGAAITDIVIKAGADSPGTVTDLEATLTGGVLSLNTKKTVNAADLTYTSVTFTATLNGVTSDPVTLNISALFGPTTTTGKLRTDKAKFTGMPNTGVISPWFTGNCTVDPTITLSTGVSIPSTQAKSSDCGAPDYSITVFAADGGNVTVNYSVAPTTNGGIRFDIPLTCAGTNYVRTDYIIVQPSVLD